MFFKNELPLDHELSLDHVAYAWAKNEVDNGICVTEERLDYEYEMAWSALEFELEFEGLKMTTEWKEITQ